MKLPLEIHFHQMAHSEALEARIREKAARLDSFCDHIMRCRVVVELPHKHHEHGNHYQVRIDLTVPGDELVVSRTAAEHAQARDIEATIGEAFDAARRQLEDYSRRHRHEVKTHAGVPHARVRRLFPEEGYGFLEALNGREIYFHQHSLGTGEFERLTVGSEVTFVEEAGNQGPQASSVKVVGRHHE